MHACIPTRFLNEKASRAARSGGPLTPLPHPHMPRKITASREQPVQPLVLVSPISSVVHFSAVANVEPCLRSQLAMGHVPSPGGCLAYHKAAAVRGAAAAPLLVGAANYGGAPAAALHGCIWPQRPRARALRLERRIPRSCCRQLQQAACTATIEKQKTQAAAASTHWL